MISAKTHARVIARERELMQEYEILNRKYARLLAAATAVTQTDEVYRGTFFNSTQGAKAWEELEKAIKEAKEADE